MVDHLLLWLQMRGLGSGAAATANWLTNAVVSHTFLPLTRAVGASGAFWTYAAITACGTAWACVQLPETKGALMGSETPVWSHPFSYLELIM